MSTELKAITEIEQLDACDNAKALELLSNYENIAPLVEHICSEFESITPDVSTKAGRQAIGSRAREVSRSKTFIMSKIDDATQDYQSLLDACRLTSKRIEEEMNASRDRILAPRKAWKEEQDRIEQARIDEIKSRVRNLKMLGDWIETETKDELSHKIDALSAIDVSDGFAEFTQEAAEAIKISIDNLNKRIIEIAQNEARAAADEENRRLREQLAALQEKVAQNEAQEEIESNDSISIRPDYFVKPGFAAEQTDKKHDVEIVMYSRDFDNYKGYEFRDCIEIIKTVGDSAATLMRVSDGEPEDATLSRDFNDCFKVLELMEQAYNAGKNGETWTFSAKEVSDEY